MDKSKKRAINPSKYGRLEDAVWDEAIEWDTTPDFIRYCDGLITRRAFQHGDFLYWEERTWDKPDQDGDSVLKTINYFRKSLKEVFS